MLGDWSRVFGLKTVVFRHSSIYGEDNFSSVDGMDWMVL